MNLPALVPTHTLRFRLMVLFSLGFLLLGAFCAEESTVRTSPAVGCNREPLLTKFAIFELAGKWFSFGIQIPLDIIVLVIGNTSLVLILTLVIFAILDLSQSLLLLSLSLFLLSGSFHACVSFLS